MLRSIITFHQDEEAHWVADLSCGHPQHTRHDPPFFSRPWVTTAEGRQSRIGTQLNCVRCDRQEIPEGFIAYRQTPVFNSQTIPKGLQAHHSTKEGIWGQLHVLTGQLQYKIHAPFNTEVTLDSNAVGVIIPEVEHEVHPIDNTEFYVEFWRRPSEVKPPSD